MTTPPTNLFAEPSPTQLNGATISPCGLYRYHLWRVWDDLKPVLCFVMQNPSTADDVDNDPTITRCIGFAKRDGYGGISVRNVFALRSTDERVLLSHPDPVGPENESHLMHARAVSMMTRLVVAWGNRLGGARLDRHYTAATNALLPQKPYCLGINKSGEPKHPLFLASGTPMVQWERPLYKPTKRSRR